MTLPIQELAKLLTQQYPVATVNIRRPVGAGKTWWLDVAMGPSKAEIEWNPNRGFGLSVNSDSVYGVQSDEAYSSVVEVLARLLQLLDSGSHTEESSEHFLRALREGRKMTQMQMAKLLRVKQASVSRLESRADFHLSTLKNIVSRLGGNLELRANFPDGSVHILKLDGDAKKAKRRLVTKVANQKRGIAESRTVKKTLPGVTQTQQSNKPIAVKKKRA